MEEKEHLIRVLKETRKALSTKNTLQLQKLSDRTIHSSSIYQHTDYIIIAIIIYSLSKIVARKDSLQIKNWDSFIIKVNSKLAHAIEALKKDNSSDFLENLKQARTEISNLSIDLKPYIQEVLRKASINKASKIYEHGISLGQTAKLLGLTHWELSEYIGQKSIAEEKQGKTLNTKVRAEMAMEFFK